MSRRPVSLRVLRLESDKMKSTSIFSTVIDKCSARTLVRRLIVERAYKSVVLSCLTLTCSCGVATVADDTRQSPTDLGFRIYRTGLSCLPDNSRIVQSCSDSANEAVRQFIIKNSLDDSPENFLRGQGARCSQYTSYTECKYSYIVRLTPTINAANISNGLTNEFRLTVRISKTLLGADALEVRVTRTYIKNI